MGMASGRERVWTQVCDPGGRMGIVDAPPQEAAARRGLAPRKWGLLQPVSWCPEQSESAVMCAVPGPAHVWC